MRRPSWPIVRNGGAADSGGSTTAVLMRTALGIEARTEGVLRNRATACRDALKRDRQIPARGGRVWRGAAAADVDLWCAVSAQSAATLLEIVLGGPGADQPTRLERSIVGETIERMISSEDVRWIEASAEAPHLSDVWRCDVRIASRAGARAELSLFAEAVAAAPCPPRCVNGGRIPLPLRASLAPLPMRLDALARWRPGTVVPVDPAAAPLVRLFLGSTVVASGTLGAMRGRRAIRVELSSPRVPS